MSLPDNLPVQKLRHARLAVATLFLVNAALLGNMLPRYPELKSVFELSNASFGLLIACWPLGSVLAGPLAGLFLRKFGSARVAVSVNILAASSVAFVGFKLHPIGVAVALLVAGAADAVTDVAQNAQGLMVQRAYKKSILNSFHATWSVGMVLGGLMGAGAISLNISMSVHLVISAVLFSALCVWAFRHCLPDNSPVKGSGAILGSTSPNDSTSLSGSTGAKRSKFGKRSVQILIGLMIIAIAGVLVEDAGNSWATLYLAEDLGASRELAPFGLIALMGAQFAGRLAGDGLVNRFGDRRVAYVGAVISLAGMGLALLVNTPLIIIVGFACAGWGVATLVPAAMGAADSVPGLLPGSGLTVVSWLMRFGFLVSPPVVGWVADAFELRVGLLVIPVAAALVIAFARVLPGREPERV